MYFLIDEKNNRVKGFKNLGIAARQTLDLLGGTVPESGDPVKTLFNHPLYGSDVQVLRLSAVFRLISENIASGKTKQASILAENLSMAVDEFYKKR